MKHVKLLKGGLASIVAAVIGIASGTASAVPALQLGIAGGTYDSTTETIVASSASFSLYAFLNPDAWNTTSDTYFLSMALAPQTSSPGNFGSFTYNGNTVNVTSDMTYGTPPVASIFPDVPGHGIYDTYYKEVSFNFSTSNKSKLFDTQLNPGSGPQTLGSGDKVMYFELFNIDTSNLASGYAIHFDLYNTNVYESCLHKTKGTCDQWGAPYTYETKVAPPSHDAQSPVPEPETYAMLLVGLGMLGLTARRRKNTAA